ncbi:MAG: hypothetical protein RI945_211 [Candidatus Parcubacteria bacterium]|jgi:peptidoglycan/xylan/chitin deacetylase (PgdA/CDA1 family)
MISSKKEKEMNHYTLAIFLAVFFLAFVASFIFTQERISRMVGVSPDEEAMYYLDGSQLEDLYKKSTLVESERIIILGYHQIRNVDDRDSKKARMFITPPEIFEKEMKFLKDHNYEVISLEEYLEYFSFKKFLKEGERKVVITFDDGYISQFENAFPILQKYDLKATFFVYANCIGKYPSCMTWDNLRELTKSGMKIGNHTLNHVFLPNYKLNTVKREIEENQNMILEKVGKGNVSNIFAYPFDGVSPKILALVEEMGYSGALGALPHKPGERLNIFDLPRYLLGGDFGLFLSLFE